MTTVVIAPYNVVNSPGVGGHFWVYMQYAQGLLNLGCEVYWLEGFPSTDDRVRDGAVVADFLRRMEQYGLGGKVILYVPRPRVGGVRYELIGMQQSKAKAAFQNAELLLNFNYAIAPALLSRFRRTALVDIDPGLLQFWMSSGQLAVPGHDVYFTTGETVGTRGAMFPDCGLSWVNVRPPVSLELWPYKEDERCLAFTTVSSWYGGQGRGEFITDGREIFYENNKRASFLDFAELPRMTRQVLELALCLDEGNARVTRPCAEQSKLGFGVPAGRTAHKHPYLGDPEERKMLESRGWKIRHAEEVSGTPESYRSYIQGSRGEFSCAKPSCMKFQNAWVSDRTLCYLSSGKPVVVQNTGPSAFLPSGMGMFRFDTLEEAAGALEAINAAYRRHCRAAREIAETYFDSKRVAEKILNCALSREARPAGRKDGTDAIEVHLTDPSADNDEISRLMAKTLEEGVSRLRRRPVRVRTLIREFFEDSSSFAAERLRALLDDDEWLGVFLKDLNPQAQVETARVMRSPDPDSGRREMQMYRHILSRERFGTPELYAFRWEPERGIYWLFLEDVGSLWLNSTGDFALWLAAARWAARFHAASRRLPASQTAFLPCFTSTRRGKCLESVREKLSYLGAQDRPLVERALERFETRLDRFSDLPASVIHGEYFGKNVLVREGSPDHPLAVVDWESAATGPSYLDLVSLTAGKWSARPEQKEAMQRAYFEQYQADTGLRLEWQSFCEQLNHLEISQALSWLGWWPDRNFSRHFGGWMKELEKVMRECSPR